MDHEENFFEKFGLEVTTGEVELNETYPIYGMITKIAEEVDGQVEVELNHSITALIKVSTPEQIEKLKERSFELGIFVGTVIDNTEDNIVIKCSTIIFGKSQCMQEN